MAFDRLELLRDRIRFRRDRPGTCRRVVRRYALELNQEEPALLKEDRDLFEIKLRGRLQKDFGEAMDNDRFGNRDWNAFFDAVIAFLEQIMPFIEMIIDLFMEPAPAPEQIGPA